MDAKPPLVDDYIYLSGRPSLQDFVGFARRRPGFGDLPSKDSLIREWRQAHEVIHSLESTEKGLADGLEAMALPEEMLPLANAEAADLKARGYWDGLDFRWRLLELDRLVVFQKQINLRFVEQITSTLQGVPRGEDLLHVAVGKAWQVPPVRVNRTDEYTFVCLSESNDLRVLKAEALDPSKVPGVNAGGYPGTVIGIFVGFTVNLLSAVYANGRYVLFNGSHRAYTLRSMGITHAPCLVLNLSDPNDFDMKAPDPVRESKDYYLRSPRPPLFKDYFDPRLRKQVAVARHHQLVQLQLGYQKIGMPAL